MRAKIIRILTYTASADNLRSHMRTRRIKGEKEVVPGIRIREFFIHASEADFMDDVSTNADDVILNMLVEHTLKEPGE